MHDRTNCNASDGLEYKSAKHTTVLPFVPSAGVEGVYKDIQHFGG